MYGKKHVIFVSRMRSKTWCWYSYYSIFLSCHHLERFLAIKKLNYGFLHLAVEHSLSHSCSTPHNGDKSFETLTLIKEIVNYIFIVFRNISFRRKLTIFKTNMLCWSSQGYNCDIFMEAALLPDWYVKGCACHLKGELRWHLSLRLKIPMGPINCLKVNMVFSSSSRLFTFVSLDNFIKLSESLKRARA